jgi:ribose transport system substrate-binding protein
MSAPQARREAVALLERMELPEEMMDRFPRQLSGGQQQRVALARAFAARPDLIICDEVTSALDVSVQDHVLDLLVATQRDTGTACLFISHDLGVIKRVASQVIVLQGTAGTSASRDRGEGFTEGIAAYPGIEIVATQTANFDRTEGLDVATNLLQSNPGVVGIFAETDEMALGAIQALGDRAGTEVFVVGLDGTDDGLTAVRDGALTATIAQQPAELGRQAVETMKKVLDGEDVAEETPVVVQTVTADDVADFLQ